MVTLTFIIIVIKSAMRTTSKNVSNVIIITNWWNIFRVINRRETQRRQKNPINFLNGDEHLPFACKTLQRICIGHHALSFVRLLEQVGVGVSLWICPNVIHCLTLPSLSITLGGGCLPKNEEKRYSDVIMGAMASQISSLTIVYSPVYSGADQIKHQRSASLASVWGIHRWPVNSPHKWPVTRKMFPFNDVIMAPAELSHAGLAILHLHGSLLPVTSLRFSAGLPVELLYLKCCAHLASSGSVEISVM